jgi:hypothetical protein
LGITTGSPPSMIAMHELVVPKSIPSTLDILSAPSLALFSRNHVACNSTMRANIKTNNPIIILFS